MQLFALYLVGALEVDRVCYVHHWSAHAELVCRERVRVSDGAVCGCFAK
jgi:hypothetical protein